MLQNASYMFFFKKKQTKTTTKKRKNCHLAGDEPETFDEWGQRIVQCTRQPLLRLFVKFIVFNIFVPTR